jgi:DNA repair protein RadA/Sms
MGFTSIIIPDRNKDKISVKNNVNLIGISSLREGINKVF